MIPGSSISKWRSLLFAVLLVTPFVPFSTSKEPYKEQEKTLQITEPWLSGTEVFLEILQIQPETTYDEFFEALQAIENQMDSRKGGETLLRDVLLSGHASIRSDEVDDIIQKCSVKEQVFPQKLWDTFHLVTEECATLQHRSPPENFHFRPTASAFVNEIKAYIKHVPKGWAHVHARGTMVFDRIDHLVSQHYELTLTEDTELIIKIQLVSLPLMSASIDPAFNHVDAEVFLLKDADSGGYKKLIGCTNTADAYNQGYSFRAKVRRGTFLLVPFSTGAWFQHLPRNSARSTSAASAHPQFTYSQESAALFRRISSEDTELTPEYKSALDAVFEMVDLDGNGSLNREEFDFFAQRSTGTRARDEDWRIVTGLSDAHANELSREEFLHLHAMEASDCKDSNVDDLWIMLESMGFNRQLLVDAALPFVLHVCALNGNPRITPTEMKPSTAIAEKAIIRTALEYGHREELEEGIVLHKITNGLRTSLIVENTESHPQKIKCYVKERSNTVSNVQFPFEWLLQPMKAVALAHFVPVYRSDPWKIETNKIIERLQ